ncbi:DUF3617 domain-containing protein [Acidithiobacillus ferriphilus]|uniref:DUF3617 domain-containing protein n=1 Tax=Acidithiobacillus ferriphilus TaxID=1689834 RepID=UPI003F50E5B8
MCKRRVLWVVPLAGLWFAATASATTLKVGEWQVQMQMPGIPAQMAQMMATHPLTMCIKAHSVMPPRAHCNLVDRTATAQGYQGILECAQAGHTIRYHVRENIRESGASFTAYFRMLGMPNMASHPMVHINMVEKGRWVGSVCTMPTPAAVMPSYAPGIP